ncbi:glycosyltransferase family 92 protein, partial [bacterium]|nr:glycosyltransferase family 92 protein [bacterium]
MEQDVPKYFLTAVLVIKDEATYLSEWIDYHSAVGVEHFYIYDNDSSDNIQDILAPYIKSGRVTYTFWPGRGQQRAEYADWHKNYGPDSKWAAIIDVDEFIIPKTCDNICDFLKNAPADCGQVYIGYNNFGSGGHTTRPCGGVMESYVWRDNGCDNLLVGWPWSDSGKCVIRPAMIHTVDIHFHVMHPGAQTYNANMAPYDIENRDRGNKLPRDRVVLN